MRFLRASISVLFAAGALSLAVCVSGCVDTVGQARVDATAAPSKIARRDGVSPRGVGVALASVEGAPQSVADAFASSFAQAASAAELSMQEPAAAPYLVRSYLSAYPAEGGVTRFA